MSSYFDKTTALYFEGASSPGFAPKRPELRDKQTQAERKPIIALWPYVPDAEREPTRDKALTLLKVGHVLGFMSFDAFCHHFKNLPPLDLIVFNATTRNKGQDAYVLRTDERFRETLKKTPIIGYSEFEGAHIDAVDALVLQFHDETIYRSPDSFQETDANRRRQDVHDRCVSFVKRRGRITLCTVKDFNREMPALALSVLGNGSGSLRPATGNNRMTMHWNNRAYSLWSAPRP